MAKTVSTSTNLDDIAGRTVGEVITINSGAVLTIDSIPTETAGSAVGDINFSTGGGEINIDGRYVKEVAYSSGSGSLPSVSAAITWDSGASTGKIIKLNSGDSSSGVMTITVYTGTLVTSDTITDGSWSASVDSVAVGFMPVYIALASGGVWDAIDATCTVRIRGDKYQIGTGDGTDYQSITLPHTGNQHAIWVETGNGTGVYEIWHRVYDGGDSTVFYDNVADWGSDYDTGKVFSCVPLSGTLNFGTSTAGGAPANGAKILIPNVHMGTTSTASPTIEINTLTLANHISIIDASVSANAYIDHLNASTVQVNFVQTNVTEVSNSFFGIVASTWINKNNGQSNFTNCALVTGNSLTGEVLAVGPLITDNIGGIDFTDCVFYGGANGGKGFLFLTTMANITFNYNNQTTGKVKIISNQQDENTMFAISGSVASNLTAYGDLILLNNGMTLLAGCTNWVINSLVYGQLLSRGSTEDTLYNSITGSDRVTINNVRVVTGGRPFKSYQFTITDSSNVTIRNFGEVDNKVDFSGTGLGLNLAGITNNCLFQRVYFTNMSAAQVVYMLNSCADITVENCGTDYNDEIEPDGNRVLIKGCHGGSGNIGATTGTEDDYINVLASIFYDIFKSDTTGGVGLIFNDRGVKHYSDVVIDSGNPVWNAIGDLIMQSGDQVTYYWPYWIKGHTGFTNTGTVCHLIGTNTGSLGSDWGNYTIQYALDTGSGYGSFQNATVANLTGEIISPAGFKIAIRIICDTSNATNTIRGLQVLTNTTIADQKANLYPIQVATVTLTNVINSSRYEIYNLDTEAIMSTGTAPPNSKTTPFSVSFEAADGTNLRVRVRESSATTKYLPFETQTVISSGAANVYVSQSLDLLIS